MLRMAKAQKQDEELVQFSIRVNRRVQTRAERLVGFVAGELGVPATRADVVRLALLRGLDVLEQQQAKKR